MKRRLREAQERIDTAERHYAIAAQEYARVLAERDATARMLAQAEDIIRRLQDDAARRRDQSADVRRAQVEASIHRDHAAALEERLEAAREEVAWWHREHSACERAQQLIEHEEAS